MKWRAQRRVKTTVSPRGDDRGEPGQDESARTSPGTKEKSRPKGSGEAELVENKDTVKY